MPIVEFCNAGYVIAGRTILAGLDLAIQAGESIVLLGRSGSGKTTALKMINGLIFPTSGEVKVDGRATRDWNPIELRRRIGYVIQEAGLFPHFTVGANVGLVPKLLGWPPERITQRVDELLQLVSLPASEYRARYPRQLSGGQRQRVGVARALAADPSILLLDEPFGALDPVTRLDLQNQFLHLRRQFNKTSVFVTHDIREALRLATRIGLLSNGRLDVLATPDEFQRASTEEAQAFLACL